MPITLDQIILDAQRIANRVKDLEALGNALLVEAEGNNRQIETMKQFQDDIDSLNKLARDKTNAEMVNRVNQQNPSLREFRQENRELKATLEDHQRALEIIMHKYREQIQHKIFANRINLKEIYNAKLQDMIYKQQEKINEMAAIMQKAASVDDGIVNNEIEIITRLKVENQGLREMLQISKQFGTPFIGCEDKAVQTETDDCFLKNNEIGNDSIKILLEGLPSTDGVIQCGNENVETSVIEPASTVTTSTTVATSTANQSNIKNLEIDSKPTLNSSKTPPMSLSLINGESEDCTVQNQVS